MPKDSTPPAFLLYVDDFSSDGIVEAMTTQEVGAYILLLCKAWREDPPGSIPTDDRVLARWARLTPDEWSVCRTGVLAAFTLGTDDRLHQKRMRKEFAKLISAEKQRKESASRAARARWDKDAMQRQCGRNAGAMPEDAIPSPSPSPSSNPPPPPKPPAADAERPAAGLAGGWDLEGKGMARAALLGTQYARVEQLLVECEANGQTPEDVRRACADYHANRGRFNGPGAIAEKLRTGHWPVNGVVSAKQQSPKSQERRKNAIEHARYSLIKAGVNDARDWSDEQIMREIKRAAKS